jgi:hypothetical protein
VDNDYPWCDTYAAQHPEGATDIIFGAACCLGLDNLTAQELLTSWDVTGPARRFVAGTGT